MPGISCTGLTFRFLIKKLAGGFKIVRFVGDLMRKK